MIVGVHHASDTLSNIDKSIAFCRDVLGLKLFLTTEGGGKETSRGVGVKGANRARMINT